MAFQTPKLETQWKDWNFVKIIDRVENRTPRQIIEYQNRLFVRCTGICNSIQECTEIMEIHFNGEVIWTHTESFFVHHMTLDGDSITTYNYDDEFSRIFIQKVTMFNDQIIVAGDGILNDSMSALLYVINKDGSLDTLIQSAKSNERAIIWDALVDQQNRLNVFIETSEAFVVGRSTIVKKYDTDYNEVFAYFADTEDDKDDIPLATELNDGRIAYLTGHIFTMGDFEWSLRSLTSIRALNEDGSIDWQFDYGNEPSWSRELLSITKLLNGDILATGRYSARNIDPELHIEDIPFMLRLTSEGEMLWERAYYELDDEGEFKIGYLLDAIELDDGSLMVVGYIRNENNDILIMKTDSEGCVIEGCETVSEIVDIDDHQSEIAGVTMYPNPNYQDQLIINVPTDIKGVMSIYNAAGSNITNTNVVGGDNYIDVSQLSKGIFFVSIAAESGAVWREKLVRM